MGSFEITLEILNSIEKALDLGYNKLYVNVDYLENGWGFLRLLAMKEDDYIIVYEATFELELCYQILQELKKSKYNITDFTTKGCEV